MTVAVPIWVRVSGIIAFVLVAVVVGSIVLGGSGFMGGQMEGMDHNGGPIGSAAPPVTPSHVRPSH